MAAYEEKEIISPVLLCDDQGNLNRESVGYARLPLITSNLTGHDMRKKKWNYWCVFGRDALISATISSLDYASVFFVYYLDYNTKQFFEKTVVVPFDQQLAMSEVVHGTIEVHHEDLEIIMEWDQDANATVMKLNAADFDGQPLKADIRISYPADLDTLNVVVPWSDELFQFTAKHHCMTAEGSFSIGEKTYTFNPDTDFAVLDYGRGVWPYESSWNWGMASGLQEQGVVGLNFGGQWTDNTGSNENAVFLNGHMTKIHEDVSFIYDRSNFMAPWKIETESSDQVRLTFEPFFDRHNASEGEVATSVHQMIGHYNGEIKLAGGETLRIDGLLGSIEEHIAKW